MAAEQFIDYYELLSIDDEANLEAIEAAVRTQLRRYSPQSKQTVDAAKFELVKKAYLTLSNPKSRTSYDAEYKRRKEESETEPAPSVSAGTMKSEIRKRQMVLTILYEHMLRDPQAGELTGKQIATGVGTDYRSLEFSLWFLREKGYIFRTDVGDLRITALGVEVLEKAHGLDSTPESVASREGLSANGASSRNGIAKPGEGVDVKVLAASEIAVSR